MSTVMNGIKLSDEVLRLKEKEEAVAHAKRARSIAERTKTASSVYSGVASAAVKVAAVTVMLEVDVDDETTEVRAANMAV